VGWKVGGWVGGDDLVAVLVVARRVTQKRVGVSVNEDWKSCLIE
jgi:hypothetical protein